MFDAAERTALRDELVEHASADPSIVACAVVGSAARDGEDVWSDIDLALRLHQDAVLGDVISGWTGWLRTRVEVADTLDIRDSGAVYRVFLLSSSLQVDLSFWPYDQFRATGEPMRILFGEAGPPDTPQSPDPIEVARLGWLYALHARSAIARGRSWQADMMLADLRNRVIEMACLRLGLNYAHGRGAHLLPADLSSRLLGSRASSLARDEQARSLRETLVIYRAELAQFDPHVAHAVGSALEAFGHD